MTSLFSNMMYDPDATESEPLGLLPYRFEPTSNESDTSSESDSDRESITTALWAR